MGAGPRYRVITSNNSYDQHFVVRGRPEERPPWSCGRRPAARAACKLRAHTVLGPYRLFTRDFRSGIATSRGNATAVVAGRCAFAPSLRLGPELLTPFHPHPLRPRHVKARPVPERSIIGDHSLWLCRWVSASASRSHAELLKLPLRPSLTRGRAGS